MSDKLVIPPLPTRYGTPAAVPPHEEDTPLPPIPTRYGPPAEPDPFVGDVEPAEQVFEEFVVPPVPPRGGAGGTGAPGGVAPLAALLVDGGVEGTEPNCDDDEDAWDALFAAPPKTRASDPAPAEPESTGSVRTEVDAEDGPAEVALSTAVDGDEFAPLTLPPLAVAATLEIEHVADLEGLPPLPPQPTYTELPPEKHKHRRLPLIVATGVALAAVAVAAVVLNKPSSSSPAQLAGPAPTVTAHVTSVVTAPARQPATRVETVTATPPAPTTPPPSSSLVVSPPVPPATHTTAPETHSAPAAGGSIANPTVAHHVEATLSAEGMQGELTITVAVSTDAPAATVVVKVSGSQSLTRTVRGSVKGTRIFTLTLTPGPGSYRLVAVVTSSSGTITTTPTTLEV